VLSLGQRELQIPKLEGATLRVARIELLRASLQAGEVSSLALPDQPMDTIVQQDPKPGSGGATPRVDLLVSAGQRETSYVMPYFIGANEAEAQHRLDQANLRHKSIYVAAAQWPHGTVVDQSPAGGSRIAANAEVELTVAN